MPATAIARDTAPGPVTPVADRPRMPREYGVPKSTKGLMDWSVVERRLGDARVYWVATCGPDGQPRVRPLDGVWMDGALYVGGSPETRWVRDLRANPRASVHLDDGSDVAILEGTVEFPDGLAGDDAGRLASASNAKYGYGMTEESYLGPGVIVIRPRMAFAWKAFPRDMTRFRFEG